MFQNYLRTELFLLFIVVLALALACTVWRPLRVEAIEILLGAVTLANLRIYEAGEYGSYDEVDGGAAETERKELEAEAEMGITPLEPQSPPPGSPPPPTSLSNTLDFGVGIDAGAAGTVPAQAPLREEASTTSSPRPARSLPSATPQGSHFQLSSSTPRPSDRTSAAEGASEVDTRPRHPGPPVPSEPDYQEIVRRVLADLPPVEHDKPEEPSEETLRRDAEVEQARNVRRRSPTTVAQEARSDQDSPSLRRSDPVSELGVNEVQEASPSTTAKRLDEDFKGPLLDLIPLSERRALDPLTAFHLEELHVEAFLGGGAYGAVYGVRGAMTRAIRAVKVVDKTVLGPSLCAELLPREQEALESLEHDNLVRAHATLQTEKYAFFVMGYVRGKTLADLLAEAGGKGLAPSLVTRIMGQLIQATLFMSAKGWLHRDLKPENIILEHNTDRVVIVDMGMACRIEEANKWTTETAGSFPTMAPEVALRMREYHHHHSIGVNITIASHTTYPLAAIYLQMATGLAPYECPNPRAAMRHLLQLVKGTRKLPSLDGIPPRTAMMLRGIFENCERPSLDTFIWALPVDMRPASYRPKPMKKTRTPTMSKLSQATPASSISRVGSHVGSIMGRDRPSRNVSRCPTNTQQQPRWRR